MANADEKAKVKDAPRKKAPVVRVSSRGQVSQALERLAAMYREQFPEREVRYVYDPTHKPELSGVMGREASGYELVYYRELGEGVKEDPEKVVRVGDLVLMSIEADKKQALRDERAEWARSRAEAVQRKFYEEAQIAAKSGTPSHHSGPAIRAIGSAKIEEKVHEYDVQQREE